MFIDRLGKKHRYSLEKIGKTLGFDYTEELLFPSKEVEESFTKLSVENASGFDFLHGISWKNIHSLPKLSVSWIDAHIGFGVFTREALCENSYCGQYSGIVSAKPYGGPYCFSCTFSKDNDFVIDAEKAGNITRFFNHSQSGNITAKWVFDGTFYRVVFFTNKPIAKGEELRFDYGKSYDTFLKLHI